MKSIIAKQTAAFFVAGMLAAGVGALAAADAWAAPGVPLTISEVFVDFTNDTIAITGEGFDIGSGPVTVTLGDPDLIAAGSIVCTPDFGASPQTIGCDFFAPGLPPDGDYLLTVATGAGQSQSDEYDLTVGAVGPRGPKGDKGDTGATGAIDLAKITVRDNPSCPVNAECNVFCLAGERAIGGAGACTQASFLTLSRPIGLTQCQIRCRKLPAAPGFALATVNLARVVCAQP